MGENIDLAFEDFFTNLDDITVIIQNELKLTYLEALVMAGEKLFQGENNEPFSELVETKISNVLPNMNFEKLSKEKVRKVFQLAILKGMKETTQPHHLMTPDAVALFMSYLVNKLTEKKEHYRIFDPAVGTANLLTAILNGSSKMVESVGIDSDETLLKLAYVSANMQKHSIELFHQDSLQETFIDSNIDIVVADLPVGYYPNDAVASRYALKAEKEMSYTHHLMIEQALNHTKSGGFLLFLIPNFMFETEQTKQLHSYIKDHAHIYALLQLPKSMFKDEKQGKSIFIIRKKGDGIKGPNQALLAELPSFSNKQGLSEMVSSINNWFDAYLN